MPDEKEQEIIIDEETDESGLVEKVKKLKEQLRQYQQEKQDNLSGWQRAQADFINYRRRQEEQMSEWASMFGEGLLKDILPVLDTYRARKIYMQAGEEAGLGKNNESDGSDVIINQLVSILKKHGLEEIKTVGEKFNPEFHNAVEQVIKEGLEGVIAEEIRKGYLLNGRVLRVAEVKVTKNQ